MAGGCQLFSALECVIKLKSQSEATLVNISRSMMQCFYGLCYDVRNPLFVKNLFLDPLFEKNLFEIEILLETFFFPKVILRDSALTNYIL